MGNVSASIKDLAIQNNVLFRVIDKATGQVVREVQGHNDATNTMLLGIAHYLQGDGVLNQASYTLSNYIPRYISLGTLGLANQDEDENGYPAGLPANPDDYVNKHPGYGSDGYNSSSTYINGREFFGLGEEYDPDSDPYVGGELVSDNFKRFPISYREIIPESRAELAFTVDIIFSAMISTGALKKFRSGDNEYIFITEAGLWSSDVVTEMNTSGDDNRNNHLLAGYRLIPTNMDEYESADTETKKQMLKKCILKVEKNQVVQVIWKIQLGSRKQFESNDSSGGQE